MISIFNITQAFVCAFSDGLCLIRYFELLQFFLRALMACLFSVAINLVGAQDTQLISRFQYIALTVPLS